MKKLFFCTLFCVWGIGLPLAGTFAPRPCFAKEPTRLYFYEAGTDFPLNGITVIIPETQTKIKMHSGEALPLTLKEREVTLLFYLEGYTDTAVFGFPTRGKDYAKYALYPKTDTLPFIAYAETPCDKDILALLTAYREWVT